MLCLSVSAALAGCDGALSTLAPAGPAATWISQLWWVMLAGSLFFVLLVLALVAWGFAKPAERQPGLRFWALGLGVVMPLSVLVMLVGAGLWIGERMQARPGPDVVSVQAQARQWAWRFVQPGPDGRPLTTDNVLFIPAGKPIDVHLSSEDVIHSFWVPRLSGKMDAIPGHRNLLRIQATVPGRYHGLSAEFSGEGYGQMRFWVVAYPPGEPPAMTEGLAGAESRNGHRVVSAQTQWAHSESDASFLTEEAR